MKRHIGAVILTLGTLTTAAAAPARPLHEPTPPPPMATKPSFRVGDTVLSVNDILNPNDAIYMGKRHKAYLVDMEAGKTYQIDMRSTAFDSYLFFENPTRQLVAQDDDSGGYPSARIIHKATGTGKFRIIASHFGGGGDLGAFSITVMLTDGPPVNKKDP